LKKDLRLLAKRLRGAVIRHGRPLRMQRPRWTGRRRRAARRSRRRGRRSSGAGDDAGFGRGGTFGTTKIRTPGLVGKRTGIFLQNDDHIT
jgi:hypothetical protein